MAEVNGWSPIDAGQTIGHEGSEAGVITRDEEHRDGARITIERDGRTAPFAITCGVYGWMAHTGFFGDDRSASEAFETMKPALVAILDRLPNSMGNESDVAERGH